MLLLITVFSLLFSPLLVIVFHTNSNSQASWSCADSLLAEPRLLTAWQWYSPSSSSPTAPTLRVDLPPLLVTVTSPPGVSSSPLWYQVKVGEGWPLAEQVNETLLPEIAVTSDGCSVIVGGRGIPIDRIRLHHHKVAVAHFVQQTYL